MNTALAPRETEYFKFAEVKQGTEEYEQYLEARYRIFCEELQRISPDACLLSQTGRTMETDKYDPYSRHIVACHKNSGLFAASARIIMPGMLGLNVTPRYQFDYLAVYPDAQVEQVGEISRMAIASEFRRRHEDQGQHEGDPTPEMAMPPGLVQEKKRKYQPDLVLGMYREIYRICQSAGISYCLAAMDNRFSRLLNTLGFPFLPVGPINESVHPPRRVYIISAIDMEKSLGQRRSNTLEFIRN